MLAEVQYCGKPAVKTISKNSESMVDSVIIGSFLGSVGLRQMETRLYYSNEDQTPRLST